MALQRKGVLKGSFGTTVEEPDTTDTTVEEVPRTADTEVVTDEDVAAADESVQNLTSADDQPADGQLEQPSQPPEPEVSNTPPSTSETPKPRNTASSSARSTTPRKGTLRAEEMTRRGDRQMRVAVEEAYKSAKRRPTDWESAPIRIAETAKSRLELRREKDFERFEITFAETHYLEAALSSIPNDVDNAIAWVEQYLDTLGLQTPASVGTTGRLRKETNKQFSKLAAKVRRKARYGYTGHLQTVALLRLLDSLDRWDQVNPIGVTDLDND